MQVSAGWRVRRFIVVSGFVALLVVVMVWNRPSPDSAPAVTPPDHDPMEAPAEAVLFQEVLSVSNAVVRDGVWYAIDIYGPQVHRLDPATGSVRTFGRKGEGPGEFRGIPGEIVVHGDSIVITDGQSLRIFGLEGQHYQDRIVRIRSSCSIEEALSLSGLLLFLVRCPNREDTSYHVLHEARSGLVTEVSSLSQERGAPTTGRVVLGPHPNGFVFGQPYLDCLELYGFAGASLGEECHEWIERLPMPEMTADQKAEIEAIREQARQRGIEVELPEYMPPFVRVSVTTDGEMVYLANAPDGNVPRLLTRSATGEQVVLAVRSAPIMIVDGDHILLGWRGLDGTRLLFTDIPRIP